MAVFEVETKNKVDIDKKPRVYFTCHPADFEKYFKKVCEDIFKTHDCAIYYTEDMTEVIAEDEKRVDLGRNNLFVIPVTFKLLTTPNRAMDEDVPYALAEHIPILPIMMEPGIDEFYSKPDKFGELQYLNPYSTDLTEISYEEKLKKYLESVLISDELAKRVRAAFDAYIFLSYRKKDRKYANELMRLIHSNPECRDIAIWFDEFLTPGESFKENIEKILDDCKLFTLLVTPQLLEKVIDENGEERDNYVISTELPLARKKKEEKGIDIFAVEMEDTDKTALSTINIADYVNPSDETFRARLLETISRMAITTNNTPEHNFLIGLAYLEGIDVEVNRQEGVKLITSAANAGLVEAMEKLQNIYYEGIGVKIDYNQSVFWGKKLADSYVTKLSENHPDTLNALYNLAVLYGENGQYQEKKDLLNRLYRLRCNVLGEEQHDTMITLSQLSSAYSELCDYHKALELSKKVHSLLRRTFGEAHPDTIISLNQLAVSYGECGNISKNVELLEIAYKLACNLWGAYSPYTILMLNNLALGYCTLGKVLVSAETQEKAYETALHILPEEHPTLLIILHNLAYIYYQNKKHAKALSLFEKVYDLRCKTLGIQHPRTICTLVDLAVANAECGNHEKARDISCEVYNISLEVFGKYNHNTMVALSNLASFVCDDGDYEKNLELCEEIYEIQCKVSGEENIDTVIALNNLSIAHVYLKHYKEAIHLMEKVYDYRRKILGQSHPNTLESLHYLASLCIKVGNRDKATKLLSTFRKLSNKAKK